MHLDVVDLRAFYYRTKLGRTAQRVLQERLREFWPETTGMTVAGFGFAAPFLRPFMQDAARLICMMPGQQGVMPWPPGEDNRSVLVEETLWPIAPGSIDRLIVAHGLETCERANALLEEIWRSLAPGGEVVFVLPNRSGSWSRSDATPFGYGRPYSFGQAEAQLRAHNFIPDQHKAALYGPPSHKPVWLKTAGMWERFGRRLDAQLIAGVLMIQATKQIYATPRPGSKVLVPGPLEVLEGLAGARPKPATQLSKS